MVARIVPGRTYELPDGSRAHAVRGTGAVLLFVGEYPWEMNRTADYVMRKGQITRLGQPCAFGVDALREVGRWGKE